MTDPPQSSAPPDEPLDLRRRLANAQAHAEHNDAVVAELRRSEELTRRLIEAMPGGVVHVGAGGAIQLANAEAQRVLGLSFDELTRRYVTDFDAQTLFEDGSPCPADAYPVSRALVTGEPQPPCTIGVQRPDGETSWAVFTAVPIRGEAGAVEGVVVTFIDITLRKQLERNLRAAQKMEAIGRLAGGVAHDFNNLLTAIVGNTHQLLSTLEADDARRYYTGEVLAACDRASLLTRHLLAMARRQPIAPVVCDLSGLVRETAEILRRMIGEDVELQLELSEPTWPVELDRSQFEQVLINLANNAKDAMPNGGRIRLSVDNANTDEVRMAFADTGSGMEPAAVERAFEPFFTTKDAARGTGLGLSTCYGIVEQAGGTITAVSQVGHGTTIEIRLPRAPVAAGSTVADDIPCESDLVGDETVLLVEDQALVRRVVQRTLERYGYRVIAACSGLDALALFAECRDEIALLLTDVVMPNMSGPEVARLVREKRPDVAVIFMSGYQDDALERHGEAVSDAALLHKPFQPAALVRLVRERLDRPSR